MSHHQGMIFVALDNLFFDFQMQKRFHRSPMVESAELLLQERVPRGVEGVKHLRARTASSKNAPRVSTAFAHIVPRRFDSAEQFSPPVCLISNGSYTVMVTSAASGYSRRGNLAVTRWREDAVRDNYGQYFYLRDRHSGAVWSAGFQPVLREPQDYEAVFTENKADFRRRDAGILTHTEIIVSAEDDAELRRISVTNESSRRREIEIISYAEIVLNAQGADQAQPGFREFICRNRNHRSQKLHPCAPSPAFDR